MSLIEKLPTESEVRHQGTWLGYDLVYNYAEVFEYNKKRYVLLDSLDKAGRLCYTVNKWKGRKTALVSYFNEYSGEPMYVVVKPRIN